MIREYIYIRLTKTNGDGSTWECGLPYCTPEYAKRWYTMAKKDKSILIEQCTHTIDKSIR